MLKIGITGGIGSGKSTVAKVFEILGIPVYNADNAAKKLMNEEGHLKTAILNLFGNEAYKEGTLNRTFIAQSAFNHPDKLEKLNALVHPETIKDANQWMQQQTQAYALKEAALLFESGAHEKLDKVIGVFAPPALRIQRVMQRDGLGRDEIIARMKRQIDENIKMRLCDYVIINDDQQLVIPQVLTIHQSLLQLPTTK